MDYQKTERVLEVLSLEYDSIQRLQVGGASFQNDAAFVTALALAEISRSLKSIAKSLESSREDGK